ncbi:MAG: PLP-dependent aminotransferase family protein [Paenibacillaceae bacterium]|jgi:GntR family transcriptional regulator/MocR family aminotransferase|nr:MAG: PLP-dependent aminotransferase family protein [Paenibacillaceae bacterium]
MSGFEIAVKPLYLRFLQEGYGKRDALYEAIRAAMLAGAVPEGARLPATRLLAASFDVSRGVAAAAYDMLHAEGYVRTAVGSGTYAAYRSPVGGLIKETADPVHPAGTENARTGKVQLSSLGRRVVAAGRRMELSLNDRVPYDLRIGQPVIADFPYDDWKRAVYAEIRRFPGRLQEDAFRAEGHEPLRSAIVRHLVTTKGIRANPEQVVVTNGSMQALALIAMLLLDPGDPAVVEDPGYPGTWASVEAAGGRLIAAKVDRRGIVPEDWPARLLFVTPSRQFPTGGVLPMERRAALLDWAARRNAVIVEDDYDSEFRWGGRPVEPLKAMDQGGCVIYIGTFSRTMLRDVRIGYAVLPDGLVEPFRRAKAWTEPHPTDLIWQRALARFMAAGAYARHLRRMQRICGTRMQRFRERLEKLPGEPFDWYPSVSGMHVYGEWRRDPGEYDAFRAACLERGVVWTDGDRYRLTPPVRRSAMFGFAHLDDRTMDAAAERMADALLRLRGRRR